MDLLRLLDRSAATEEFKADVRDYVAGGPAARIELERPTSRVKVLRLLANLLHSDPDLSVQRVRIRARSGCSDFRGVIRVEAVTGPRQYEFTWCCRWRAEEEGWTDWFGFPDQIRAAREFDWRCFKDWRSLDEDPFDDSDQLSAAR
jgi:hypothetical protein